MRDGDDHNDNGKLRLLQRIIIKKDIEKEEEGERKADEDEDTIACCRDLIF